MELGRCLAADGDRLKSVVKIGVEPRVGLPSYAKVRGQTVQQYGVIDSVECCAKVQKHE